MVVLGLIILIIAIALGALLLIGTGAPELTGQKVDITLFDQVTIEMNPLALVVAGMLTMFLFWLGLVLIKSALARRARQRREHKEQERAARERRAVAEEERLREQKQHEAELRDQRIATETARERAEVAESERDSVTRPIDTRDRHPGSHRDGITRGDERR